jgi:hypothetical protein
LILLVAAQWAWALAAAAVARQWLEGRAFWLGLALIFALPGHYGSQAESAHDVLRYAETFLTARSWAEPLVLAAVAAALARRQRPGRSPLPCWRPVPSDHGASRPDLPRAYYLRPGFRTLVALAVLAAAAAFLLLPEMDALWLAEVRRRARFVMLDSWTWGELLEPLAWIGILLAASAQASDRQRAACAASPWPVPPASTLPCSAPPAMPPC